MRKIRRTWFFRHEPTEDISENPAFRIKLNWSPSIVYPALEILLSQMEEEIFSLLPCKSTSYNLTNEEWKAMRGLAEDRSIVIKPAHKGFWVVVWDRLDYFAEAKNYHKDDNTYKDVKFGEDDLVKLVEESNKLFKQLFLKQNISSSGLKYFSYNYKKSTNLGIIYLLLKIHIRLEHVPGRSGICNSGTTTENFCKFLNYHIKYTMQSAKSYTKDTSVS